MRSVFLGAAMAAALAIAPATAADLSNPTGNVEYMKAADVAALLTELGAREVQIEQSGNDQYIHFMDGEIPYNVGFLACENTGCLGLVVLVGFDLGATRYPLELFNNFNKDHPFVSVVQLDGGKFAVSRMIVTEGGVTRKNLATNIAAFAAAPSELMKYLGSQFVAGYQPSGAPPFQPVTANQGLPRPVALSKAEIDQIKREKPALGLNLKH